MLLEPKGTLSIDLTQKSYNPGEMIKGTVRLTLDKPIKARRFSISFIGEEWIDISCGAGKSRRSKKEEIEIHNEEMELSGEGMYDFARRNFQFRIPEDAPPTIWMEPQDPILKTDNSKKWRIDTSLFSSSISYGIPGGGAGFRWVVKAKLDVPWGRDKNAREEIFVS